MGPDEELLGVVVHSGLVLGRSDDVAAAIRRITAFPSGLALDTVVLARDIHAQAAGRREHAATAQRRAAETAQQLDEVAAQYDSGTEAKRDGLAAADRPHALKQAMIERRYLPSFDRGDRLRLGVEKSSSARCAVCRVRSGRRRCSEGQTAAVGRERALAQDPSVGAFFEGSTAGGADGLGRPSPSRIDSRRAAPSASMEARSTWSMRASTEVDCSSASPSARA